VTLYKRTETTRFSLDRRRRHLKSMARPTAAKPKNIEREFREELNRRRQQIRDASPDMTSLTSRRGSSLTARLAPTTRPTEDTSPYFGSLPSVAAQTSSDEVWPRPAQRKGRSNLQSVEVGRGRRAVSEEPRRESAKVISGEATRICAAAGSTLPELARDVFGFAAVGRPVD